MNTTEKLTLIEGRFSHEDAKEILLNIFQTKIHFHELKNFSAQERFGKEDETARKRIPELKKSIEHLLDILDEAEESKKELIITSQINITLSE